MKEDDLLSEEVAMHRRELELVKQMEEVYWLDKMKAWRSEMASENQLADRQTNEVRQPQIQSYYDKENIGHRPKGIIYRRFLTWSTVAAVVLLIAFFWFLQPGSSFSILEERVIPNRYVLNERSSDSKIENADELERLFIEGYNAIEAQQYQLAEDNFQMIERNPKAEQWLLQAVEYNRALLRLELGNTQDALRRLSSISDDSSHRYHRDAERLLKRLGL